MKSGEQSNTLWQTFLGTKLGQHGPAHSKRRGDSPFDMSLFADRTPKH